MTRSFNDRLRGIHAATIVPMKSDFLIDERALAVNISWVASVPCINGLLVNGHAGENFMLSLAEKLRIVEIARQHSPKDCLIISGVNHEASLEAAREAAALEKAGVDGLLVFPPNSWALMHADSCVMEHHQRICDATTVPLMLYGAPVSAGAMAYSPPVLEHLVADRRFVAIKEGSWEVSSYEQNLRLIRRLRPDFSVLSSGDEHLLTSYIIGSDGSQVSLAAVVPELVVSLWKAAEAGDWGQARAMHEKLYPVAVAIYRDAPLGRATARPQGMSETSREATYRRVASATSAGDLDRAKSTSSGAAHGRRSWGSLWMMLARAGLNFLMMDWTDGHVVSPTA